MKKEKSEQWWRWLLFIPAGVLFALIAIPVGRLINYLTTLGFLGFANGLIFRLSQIIVEVAMMYGSAAIAAMVAPNNKVGGIIYSSLMLVAIGVSITLSIISKNSYGWEYYVGMAGCFIAMIFAIVAASNDKLGY